MVDRYAGLFELRVFKNQYSVEFLLPTGKRCRECERFARKIVDNMNDSPIQLIGMRPNDAMKLERVYSKPSVKYNRPIGIDEPHTKGYYYPIFACSWCYSSNKVI